VTAVNYFVLLVLFVANVVVVAVRVGGDVWPVEVRVYENLTGRCLAAARLERTMEVGVFVFQAKTSTPRRKALWLRRRWICKRL